jgi:hypothetical protein
VSIPGETEEDEVVELAIPEQFVTIYDKTLKKTISKISTSHF